MKPETSEVLRKLETCDDTLSDAVVAAAIEEAAGEWERTARQISMQGVSGAPDWFLFERKIWDLGESLRLCLVKRKAWRSWSKAFEVISRLAIDPRFHKGRQSLVLLLGEFAADRHQDALRRLLDDDEVRGHALMALRRGKVIDAALFDLVRELADRERGWVRTQAKKYLKLLGTR
jgi:hypothetical protein